jgi:RNA polymerase sigma-B factor
VEVYESTPVSVRVDGLMARLSGLAPGDADRVALRASAIEWYLPMAVYLARRFAGRGEPQADLTQVAVIGLIKAVDRFDACHGVPFPSYAIPTILGELKRHFRDTTWNVRVPRRVQEVKLHLVSAIESLAQALRRSPTTEEVAARLGVSPRDVLLAEACATAYRPISVHQPAPGHGDLYLIDMIADTDHGMEAVDNRETLRALIADLPAREQRVIRMRFFADMTQAQIAAEIGVSQMHVSRLLSRTLAQLRDEMLTDTTAAAGTDPINGSRSSRAPATRTVRRQSADLASTASTSPVSSPRG